ncbi:MAG: fibronectin type III domain-containing protein [Candidatus Micrarchaeota archaeon]
MEEASSNKERAQTTTEYLFLVVGVIIFIVLVYTLLQGNLVGKEQVKTQERIAGFLKIGEYLLFSDNFDAGRADQWKIINGDWGVENKEYVQSDIADEQKTTYAGKAGWVNFYADALVQFSSLPATSGFLGGIAGRVNKLNGNRYVCGFVLTNPANSEGTLTLYRFFSWQGDPVELKSSLTFQIDTNVHAIGIKLAGNDVGCLWDDEEKLIYNDATPFKFGMLALEQRLAETHFDSVRAKSQAGADPTGPTPTPLPSVTPSITPSPSPSVTASASPSASPPPHGFSCLDGTPLNSCSSTKPLYCEMVLVDPIEGIFAPGLVPKCSTCSCPGSEECLPSGNCSSGIVISNVTAYNLTFTNAIVNWSTNFAANGTVEYGNSTQYGANVTHSDMLFEHSLVLAQLERGTDYHYRITSCNATDCATSGNYNFTTPSFIIYDVLSAFIEKDTALILWTTDIKTNSTIEWGIDTSYGNLTTKATFEKVHAKQLTLLHPNTLYHFRVSGYNASLHNVSQDYNFTTLVAPFCMETDGGINALIPGNLTDITGNYSDYCIDETRLREYYCSSPIINGVNLAFNCTLCSNAICLDPYCGKYSGTVYNSTGSYSDYCNSTTLLKYEYSCDYTTVKLTTTPVSTCIID